MKLLQLINLFVFKPKTKVVRIYPSTDKTEEEKYNDEYVRLSTLIGNAPNNYAIIKIKKEITNFKMQYRKRNKISLALDLPELDRQIYERSKWINGVTSLTAN